MLDGLLQEAFILFLIISGFPVLVGSVVGVCIAVLQAATQVQEQSLLFLAKVGTLISIFLVCGQWFLRETLLFFERVLTQHILLVG